MTATDDHRVLPLHAERLVTRLEGINLLTIPGSAAHMQHSDHAKRARQLAAHLRAVMPLAETFHYPSALVVVRTALEHHLMDRLILLATRYVQVHPTARRRDAAEWVTKLEAARAGDQPDIASWFWDRQGRLNIVRRGLHSARSKKGRGQTVSSYYFSIDHYDPFVGPKRHAGALAAPFQPRDDVRQQAEASATAWESLFRYEAIMTALRVNHLLPGRHVQVDVHYGFLSAFAHPSKRAYEAVFGRGWPDRMGSFDHYASELLLLYVIVIAAAELETYGRMARRTPRLELRDWNVVLADVRQAQLDASYFWFLSGAPEVYDRIETVHTPPGNRRLRWGTPKVTPDAVKPTRIRYYRDPLARLVGLHRSYQELSTGLTYVSPFERQDALFR